MARHSDMRLENLVRFYRLMDELERRLGGARKLGDCEGAMGWPERGVYFFREAGEWRSDSLVASEERSDSSELRIVRVGTHAIRENSRATLWNRLSQHRGSASTGAGNHRGSVFRKQVGFALMARDGHSCPTWGEGDNAPTAIKTAERPMERSVSQIIGEMEVLWLEVADPPSKESLRSKIEENAVALLSNYGKEPLDAPSWEWLGHHSPTDEIRSSGLWNIHYVDDDYDPDFLDIMEELISNVGT